MAISIKTETIANEIYSELENPTNISVGSISFWIQSNIGQLNILLCTEYTLNDAGNEISPELGLTEKDILKTMFLVYYYAKMIRTGLGASAFDSLLEVSSDGGTVRTLNRNEVAKTYIQMKKDEQNKLNILVSLYKSNGADPIQVTGDDTFSSEPFNISPSFDRNRLG